MRITFVIWLVVLLLLTACVRQPIEKVLANHDLVSSDPEIQVFARDSRLKTRSSLWAGRRMSSKSGESLHSVFFIDPKHGWAGGDGASLLTTNDGGVNWQPVRIDASRDLKAQNIYFLNAQVGWIGLQKDPANGFEDKDTYFKLIHTIDGGRNWDVQYESKAIRVTQLVFASEQNGWLTGIAYKNPLLQRYLILHTTDQGKHWNDASLELKRMIAENPHELSEGIMGVAFKEPITTTVITSDLRLFSTGDDGRSWARLGSLQNKLGMDSSSRRFGVIDGKRFWSIGGRSSSDSGTTGHLFLEQDNHSWVKYILDDVFFTDAIYLSHNRFLACGFSMVKRVGRAISTHPEGIILYSPDNGLTWEVVYNNPEIQRINALTVLPDGSGWAVGENGTIIRLTVLR